MLLSLPHHQPFSDVNSLGIALTKVPPVYQGQGFGIHLGFLYQLDQGEPRIADFAWHLVQRDEPANESYAWAQVALEEPNARVIASWLSTRRERPDQIPYGFSVDGSVYDRDADEFIPPPVGHGLTCATFVIAVLKHLGFQLLDEESWPTGREEDALWQAGIIDALKWRASPEHLRALSDEVGARRFRPEEVAASTCFAPDWPISFDNAHLVAEEIVRFVGSCLPIPSG